MSSDSHGTVSSAANPAGSSEGDPLADWVVRAGGALSLDPTEIDIALLLGLARDVAHGVARPAAPLTAFLVGLAAGRSTGDPAAVRAAVDTVLGLIDPSSRD